MDGADLLRLARDVVGIMRHRRALSAQLLDEDAVQIAALGVLEATGLPDGRGPAYRVAQRALIDHMRKAGGRSEHVRAVRLAMGEHAVDSDELDAGSSEWCPEQILIARQALARMLAVSPRVAEAVAAMAETDSLVEAGRRLGVTNVAVHRLMSRALEAV
jgi:DNA-directed RNA polymerase specialized sigma24 family protein